MNMTTEQKLEIAVEAMKKVRANLAEYGYPNWGDEYWNAEKDVKTIDAALEEIKEFQETT